MVNLFTVYSFLKIQEFKFNIIFNILNTFLGMQKSDTIVTFQVPKSFSHLDISLYLNPLLHDVSLSLHFNQVLACFV